MRWDLDEPILFSYKCKIDAPMCSLDLMTELKAQRVDILKLMAEQSQLFYYEPSSMWTLNYDFRKAVPGERGAGGLSRETNSDYFLGLNGKEVQREVIRLKVKSKWLVLEMKMPTLTVITNFDAEQPEGKLD